MADTTRLTLTPLETRANPSAHFEDVLSLPADAGMGHSGQIAEVRSITVPGVQGDPLRMQPRPRYVVATQEGRPTTVQVYDGPTNALLGILTPFDDGLTAGVNVAVADMTGDGVDDLVVASGGGRSPEVRVFDGRTLLEVRRFLAYEPEFTGGVFVAAGDVTGDGRADIVTGAGLFGGPRMNVFDGQTYDMVDSIFVYEEEFRGGVNVAIADTDADGYADIVTGAGPGGGPRVRVLSGRDGSVLEDFFAFDPATRTGVAVSAGEFGRGRAEILAVPMTGGPEVRRFDSGELAASYRPFGDAGLVGSAVARDLDQDGVAELIAASAPGTAPRVVVWDALADQPDRDLPALMPDYTLGLRIG